MIGDSITSELIQKALDGTWQRQKAISNNIANHETPGYKAQKVSFESELAGVIRRRSQNSENPAQNTEQLLQGIRDSEISVYSDSTTSERADGNNVNLDAENIDLVKCQLQYQYLVRGMSDMFARIKTAIKG